MRFPFLLACLAMNPVLAADPVHALRFATFNASLAEDAAGALADRLAAGDDGRARRIAAIIQQVRPQVLLINEFDFDDDGRAERLFVERYLAQSQFGEAPIHYPYRFSAPVNTGVPSGMDLDGDGSIDSPGDAWGYGHHPGQFGMLVLSTFPIDRSAARTFRNFRWSQMPGALRPLDPVSGKWFWPDPVWKRLRLSSKSHWDLPIDTPFGRIHLLAAHPTPPVFDGPENRNGMRNFDEIRLWADYLRPERADYIIDDQGRRGGLRPGSAFVVAGDYNADPSDGESMPGAIVQLLDHPRIDASRIPTSQGGIASSAARGGVNDAHRGDPAHDTSAFTPRSGNLRVDYVLPARELEPVAAGVFWPREGEPGADWVEASDHRLVWLDVVLRVAPPATDRPL